MRPISSALLPAVLTQRKADVLGDRHAVEQCRLLEEETEADALAGQFPVAKFGQIAAVEVDGAGGGAQEADDCFQQAPFCRTRFRR